MGKELKLQPIGKMGVSGINGDSVADVYNVHLLLPSGEVVLNVEALGSEYSDYDVVIGMDVILLGHFHFDIVGEHSEFSFYIK